MRKSKQAFPGNKIPQPKLEPQIRILLDTNILIGLEDTDLEVPEQLSTILRLGSRNNCEFLIHPISKKDLEKDKNKKRREIVLSKIEKYVLLEEPIKPDIEFLSLISVQYSEPQIDDWFLISVYKNSVHLLVTEDKGIHKKAKRLGIDSQVYSVAECLEAFDRWFKEIVLPANIKDVQVYSLNHDDGIFNSLRDDYSEFDNWLKKISKQGRKAWVVFNDSGYIEALCIYKQEHSGETSLPGRNVLKLCTFKVKEEARGSRIGELLLKAAFKYGISNIFDGIYTTLFPHHENLIDFLEDFGFIKNSVNYRGEEIYYKTLRAPDLSDELSPLDYNINYYPNFLMNQNVRKFLIPIRPSYHGLLFPEAQQQLQPSLWSLKIPVSNSIKKAYICNSRIKKIKPGDLILFYRSEDYRLITNLGFVEKLVRASTAEEIISLVGKRTAYPIGEIKKIYSEGGLVLFFREIKPIEPMKKLTDVNLPPPQSIVELDNETFSRIIA